MPVDRTQLLEERTDALFRVIAEDGATPAGSAPADHVAALRDVQLLGDAGRVADAHADGRGPPTDLGGSSE